MAYTIPHAILEPPDDAPYSDRDWPESEKKLAAMITHMDRDVGRIVDLLKELGLDRDTIVIFTSDNGPHREGGSDPEFFNANGILRGIKRDLYDGGIRVPFIAACPGRIRAGSTCHAPVAFQDLLPTAADLSGAKKPAKTDGLSFAPLMWGDLASRDRELYWEFHERGFHEATRFGNWKAVRHGGPDSPVELFDLASDPSEKRDVAGGQPAVVAKAERIMKRERVPHPSWPAPGEDEEA